MSRTSDYRDRHLLHHSSNILADQTTITGLFVSKISGDQVVRTSASANVNPGSGGTYQITVGIERVEKTRLVGVRIRLNSLQRVFVYEE
jgi:hypothetical protein